MSEKSKLGLWVLASGLALGAAGDALLRATPWGLNVLLWVGLLVAAAFALKGVARGARGGEGGWALPCALLFASAFAWRGSPALLALDGLAVLALLSVALLGARGGRVRGAGATDYVLAGVVSAGSAAFAPLLLLFHDIAWREVPRRGWSGRAWAALRGLAIAAPLVLLFGALFTAADAVYAELVRGFFRLDVDLAVSHVLLFLFLAWVSAGYLRGVFLGRAGVRVGGRPAHVLLGLGQAGLTRAREFGRGAVSPQVAGARARSDARPEISSARPRDAEGVQGTATPAYLPKPPSVTEMETEGPAPAHVSAVSEEGRAAEAVEGDGALTEDSPAPARAGVASPPPPASPAAPPVAREAATWPSLGVVEVGVALGALNALFFSFVAVQLRYFFGGAGFVAGSAGLTYAEYARRGFFELVWVAALVLPVLLAAHWLLRKERPAHERVFRYLAAGLLVMLFVVMASAVGRMRLYQSEYGQTELRFYTTAFMGWLALVFVWFSLTVLRGARQRFACGALVAALAVLGLLNAVNPNARIVRANAELARGQRAFDAAYATSLGADAVPALLAAVPDLRPAERAEVARRLLEWTREDDSDWRSGNLSRAKARRAVRDGEAQLREWARLPPAIDAAPAGEKVAEARAAK